MISTLLKLFKWACIATLIGNTKVLLHVRVMVELRVNGYLSHSHKPTNRASRAKEVGLVMIRVLLLRVMIQMLHLEVNG